MKTGDSSNGIRLIHGMHTPELGRMSVPINLEYADGCDVSASLLPFTKPSTAAFHKKERGGSHQIEQSHRHTDKLGKQTKQGEGDVQLLRRNNWTVN